MSWRVIEAYLALSYCFWSAIVYLMLARMPLPFKAYTFIKLTV